MANPGFIVYYIVNNFLKLENMFSTCWKYFYFIWDKHDKHIIANQFWHVYIKSPNIAQVRLRISMGWSTIFRKNKQVFDFCFKKLQHTLGEITVKMFTKFIDIIEIIQVKLQRGTSINDIDIEHWNMDGRDSTVHIAI